MGFFKIISRKKINITLTFFIVACILCVTAGTGNTMSRKACKKLRTEIRTLRTALSRVFETNQDLLDRYGQAAGGEQRRRLLRQFNAFADLVTEQRRNLEAKETTWDTECRGKLFLDDP